MFDEPSVPLFDDLGSELAESNRKYSERLMSDRLTAEFRAPLTSATRRKRLKPASGPASLWQDPEQISLIGETQ